MVKYNITFKQIQNKCIEIRKATHINIFGQVRTKKMASAVVKQPTSCKSEQEDTNTLKKILPDDKSLNKILPDNKSLNKILPDEKSLKRMNPDEKNLEKILPDKRFLRKESPASDAVVMLLDGVDWVVINQKVEVAETGMGMLAEWLCSCCKVGCLALECDLKLKTLLTCSKVETENNFVVKDSSNVRQFLLAKENSKWCTRNPCLCFNCSSRRPFTLTLMEEEGSPMVLEMFRPLALDCLPCCLQSIVVRDQTNTLGSVNQVSKF